MYTRLYTYTRTHSHTVYIYLYFYGLPRCNGPPEDANEFGGPARIRYKKYSHRQLKRERQIAKWNSFPQTITRDHSLSSVVVLLQEIVWGPTPSVQGRIMPASLSASARTKTKRCFS